MKRYHNTVINDATGLPVASPTVTVYHDDGVTVAPIYSDEGITAKPNPFTGDAKGRLDFYAPDADYVVKGEAAGVTATQLSDVTVADEKRGGFGVSDDRVMSMANAFYLRRTAAFNRIDAAKPAWALELDATAGTDYFRVLRAAAAANPITWTELLRLTSGGHLIFGTDNAQDIGASGTSRPRTLHTGSDVIAGRDILLVRSDIDAAIAAMTVGKGIRFATNGGVQRWVMASAGHWEPDADIAVDIGGPTMGVRDAYIHRDLLVKMGTSTDRAKMVGVASVNTGSVGNTAGVETDLMSYTLPANALSANGKGVRILAYGVLSGTANSKDIRLYWGTEVVKLMTTSDASGRWVMRSEIFRTGASAQESFWWGQVRTTAFAIDISTHTRVETAAQIIKITGNGAANRDVICEGLFVEFIN